MAELILPYQSADKPMPMREKLLCSATRLFTQKGYNGTSLADIAKQCDIRKASIFYYFSSKEEVALSALKYLHDYCKDQVFKPLYNRQLAFEKQRNQFVAISKAYLSSPHSALPVSLATELTGIIEAFDNPLQNYFTAWITAIEQLLGKNKANSDVKENARDVVAQIKGALLLARVYQDNQYIYQACNKLLMIEE